MRFLCFGWDGPLPRGKSTLPDTHRFTWLNMREVEAFVEGGGWSADAVEEEPVQAAVW